MNLTGSQCSSGCESGWTVYLDESCLFVSQSYGVKNERVKIDDEEDLSMVSDASSMPRYFYQDYQQFHAENERLSSAPEFVKSRNKKKVSKSRRQQSCLDDTASSPVLMSFYERNTSPSTNEAAAKSLTDSSQGFSSTHSGGNSEFYNPLGFLQSSLNEEQSSQSFSQGRKLS